MFEIKLYLNLQLGQCIVSSFIGFLYLHTQTWPMGRKQNPEVEGGGIVIYVSFPTKTKNNIFKITLQTGGEYRQVLCEGKKRSERVFH